MENTTLQTDKTSKFGVTFGDFSPCDEECINFVLILREMATKSAQRTLNTLKDISDGI